ncbi:unnamed protein product [Calicophoron daubneyi]|uniref:E3 ubiquitin-protein ligase UBR5 n=1 Tax=Calicophoron daubneyi TaxID=300641 RepID=A0AAV2U1K4_CALDB
MAVYDEFAVASTVRNIAIEPPHFDAEARPLLSEDADSALVSGFPGPLEISMDILSTGTTALGLEGLKDSTQWAKMWRMPTERPKDSWPVLSADPSRDPAPKMDAMGWIAANDDRKERLLASRCTSDVKDPDQSSSQIQNGLYDKLRDISDQIKKDGVSIPDVLRPLTQHPIAQCVDGRVCRVSYSIRTDRAQPKADSKKKTGSSRSESPSTFRDGASNRSGNGQHGVRSYRSPLSVLSRTSRGISLLREMQRQGIYLTRPVASQIPASEVPENLIEECQTVLEGKSRQVIIRELQHTNLDVNMAVNNLLSRDDETEQGNGAAGDDGAVVGSLAAGSDDWDDDSVDLLSFFEYSDSHILFDSDAVIPDELVEPPTSPRPRGDLSSEYDCGFLSDRRKRRRMESHVYGRNTEAYNSRGQNNATESTASAGETAKTPSASGCARHFVQLGDHLEFWQSPGGQGSDLHFKQIAALHSELVALSNCGDLHQWRWADSVPFFMPSAPSDIKTSKTKVFSQSLGSEHADPSCDSKDQPAYYHSRTVSLGLINETITRLSGCITRATVMTASGKFATWIDESLVRSLPCSLANCCSAGLISLEHRATHFCELRDETVLELHTAPLVTVIRCQSGAVYWWGVYPTYMRQRTIEKSRQHRSSLSSPRSNVAQKTSSSGRPSSMTQRPPAESNATDNGSLGLLRSSSSLTSAIAPGVFVRMKSAPIFHAGAVGFTVAGGTPKVGTLLEDAWKTTDVCRFRVTVLSSPGTNLGLTGNDNQGSQSNPQDDLAQHLLSCPHALVALNSNGSSLPNLGSSHTANSFSASASPSPAANEQSTLSFQEMPPPPSPASSTCSDQSGPVRVSPGTFKRKKVSSTSSDRGDRALSDCEVSTRSGRGRSADRDFASYSSSVSASLVSRRLSAVSDVSHHTGDLPNKPDVSLSTSITEEDWCLSDVIFVEDGRTQPVGIVLKVDGNIAAVKFLKEQERSCLAVNCIYSPACQMISSVVNSSSTIASAQTSLQVPVSSGSSSFGNTVSGTAPDPVAWLNDCRLLRKDDLAMVRFAGSVRVPEFLQRTPRKIFSCPSTTLPRSLNTSESKSNGLVNEVHRSKILALAVENGRVHLIVEHMLTRSQQLAYQIYNLSGKLITNHKLPAFGGLLHSSDTNGPSADFTCPAEHPILLRDASGLVVPFSIPNRSSTHEGNANPILLDLPPVQCAAFSWTNLGRTMALSGAPGIGSRSKLKSQSELQPKSLLGLIVIRDLTLMQQVLRANDGQVERLLSDDETNQEAGQDCWLEMVDGQRNLMHMAVGMCVPQSNRETTPEWTSRLDTVFSSSVKFPADEDPTHKRFPTTDPSTAAVGRPSPTFWSSIARSTSQSVGLSMHELFIRSSIEAAAVAAAASASSLTSLSRTDDRDSRPFLANGTNFWHLPPVRKDELTRRVASYRIVRLLVESRQLRPHLARLLMARNAENLTPFMLAVKYRAYAVARFLYEAIQCLIPPPIPPLCLSDKESFTPDSSIEPNLAEFFSPLPGRADDSPLFLLCYNDTCSFTWTGPDHIRQDIFECRTCGLMDSLCCCTECARVCHKGHDCRLKRTSPTAYCDCWEKCRCQSLIAGAQAPRQELFYRLLQDTNLIRLVNSKNEHLLLFLAKCVERQFREQKQHRPSRRRLGSVSGRTSGTPTSTSATNSLSQEQSSGWDVGAGNSNNPSNEEPDHDLDPPRFARDALELALDCPSAVESILNFDAEPFEHESRVTTSTTISVEEAKLVLSQGGANQLDDFVFTLVCKCPAELVDTLLSTLNRSLSLEAGDHGPLNLRNLEQTATTAGGRCTTSPSGVNVPTRQRMRQAAGRFVRSVARIYTSICLELNPDHKRKKSRLILPQPAPLDVCRHIFNRLAPVALAELPAIAIGLLTPIRTGTVRPSATFSLTSQPSDAVQGLDQYFSTERGAHSRRQLMESNEQLRAAEFLSELTSVSDLHSMLSRNEDHRTTRISYDVTDRQGQRTCRNRRTSSLSPQGRATAVSTVHVQLASSRECAPSTQRVTDTTNNTLLSRVASTPSPPVGSSVNDPSLLTLQMQSTIRDIENTGVGSAVNAFSDATQSRNVTSADSHEHQLGSLTSCGQPNSTVLECVRLPNDETSTSAESVVNQNQLSVQGKNKRNRATVSSAVHRHESTGACSTSTQIEILHSPSSFTQLLEEQPNDVANDLAVDERNERILPIEYPAEDSHARWPFSQSPPNLSVEISLTDTATSATVSDYLRRRPLTLDADSSNNESCPKRRRTLVAGATSPIHDRSTYTCQQTSDDVGSEAGENDEIKTSFGLLDGDGSPSQASSTGATVATTVGSALDLDVGSDLTSGSLETCNSRNDRGATGEFTVTSLTIPSEQVGNVPDLPTPVELSSRRDDELSYGELLNSDVAMYQSNLNSRASSATHTVDRHPSGEDGQGTLSISNQVRIEFPVDENSDGQVSDYDDEDEEPDEGEEDGEENDEDDDENETDEDGDEDGYGDEGDELIEGEDDEDDDNDDDSSHHSGASSPEGGSRSASPTWVPWSRGSVFSRLSSRTSSHNSTANDGGSALTTSAATLSSRRGGGSQQTSSVSSSAPLSSAVTTSSQQSARSGLGSGRRTIQSVINLLSTSAPSVSTPTLVVSSGTGSNVTNPDTPAPGPLIAVSEGGCFVNTQVHLSRAFGCLLRIVADLIVGLREDAQSRTSSLRRCASVPAAVPPRMSVYEQQRALPIYGNTNSTSSAPNPATSTSASGTHPHTLLLSSPLSSTNLSSGSFGTRSFGPPISDYQLHGSQSIQSNQPLLTPACSLSLSSGLPQIAPSSRINLLYRYNISEVELVESVAAVGVSLSPIWQWVSHALDNLEAQLRYSSAWNSYLQSKHSTSAEPSNLQPHTLDISSTGGRRGLTSASETSSGRPVLSFTPGSITRTGSTRSDGILSSSMSLRNDQSNEDASTSVNSNVLAQRQDLISYLFSLMRAAGSDHGDGVPFVDPAVHKHLAYVLDALLYFFKAFESAWPSGITQQLMDNYRTIVRDPSGIRLSVHLSHLQEAAGRSQDRSRFTEPDVQGSGSSVKPAPMEADEAVTFSGPVSQRGDSFFRRSESVLSLSGLGLDLIETSLWESLPLAVQPHRLHPNSTRTELFGSARYCMEDAAGSSSRDLHSDELLPVHLNSGCSTWGNETASGGNQVEFYLERLPENSKERVNPTSVVPQFSERQLCRGGSFLDSIGHPAALLARWCLSLEFFGRHFANDVGAEHRSYILELGGFAVKEVRFRKQMERLRNASRRDLVLEVERDRASLIMDTVRQLNAEYSKRQTQTTSQSTCPGSLTATTGGIGRYSIGYSPFAQGTSTVPTRQSSTGSSPVAVALLLGTTTESPLLGTLFGASPVSTNPTALNQLTLLSCHRVKVTFVDEPGEGSGVTRSFYTVFSEAVLSQEAVPQLTVLLQPKPSTALSVAQPHSLPYFHHRHYTNLGRSQNAVSGSALTRSTAGPLIGSLSSSRPIMTATTTGIGSSSTRLTDSIVHVAGTTVPISFFPYPGQTRLSQSPSSGRARTSAWRRAGGLSASALPFYPTNLTQSRSPTGVTTISSSTVSESGAGHRGDGDSSKLPAIVDSTSVDHSTLPGFSTDSSPVTQSGSSELPSRSLSSTSFPPTSLSNSLRSIALETPVTGSCVSSTGQDSQLPSEINTKQSIGNRLYARVNSVTRNDYLSARITGMLLELPPAEHYALLSIDDALRNRIEEARAVFMMADSGERERSSESHLSPTSSSGQIQQPILERLVNWRGVAYVTSEQGSSLSTVTQQSPSASQTTTTVTLDASESPLTEGPERVPLFWQPGLQGYYFPRAVPGINITNPQSVDPVKLAARYSIYRGIGRVIGLCLLTNETCPLHFSRPVLKYILGRALHWHDFAFYDPTTYEGLRQLLRYTSSKRAELPGCVADYNLTFSLIPALEEGGVTAVSGLNQSHLLAPQGEEVEVTETNVCEFVKRYTEFKMVEAVREPLEQLRQGVFDVLPRNALDGLTAEDLRLLLNGAGEIDVEVLASYTTFHDETGASNSASVGKNIENSSAASILDKVARLKRWFWNTVRNMDSKQRQELLYFWTSSPTLPASAQGFQPMPSITIRPADDHHLPSANTCISRLYLPLYSSKHILREKLLQAIETKSFGFV